MDLQNVVIFVLVVILALPIATFAQDDAAPETGLDPELVALFAYDQSAPVEIEEVGSEVRDGVTVKDITFTSPVDGEVIPAYLVLPEGDGPHPGILWVHWYEPSSPNSNRTQFLEEAVTLAQEGVVSLLPATNWSEPSWYGEGRSPATDYEDSIRQVVNLRRALDVLMAQDVDPDRVGYVGHDFGAMYGAGVAGVDKRPDVYVLIAGTKAWSDWFLFGQDAMPADERAAFIEHMATIDPTVFIADAAPAYLYFQFGNDDPYVPPEVASEFFQAASAPKAIARYDVGHDMEGEGIRDVRLSILRWKLGL
jgi:dienelactone hydrolase